MSAPSSTSFLSLLPLVGALALAACGANEPPPAVPGPAHSEPIAAATPPVSDEVSCARRKAHDAACPSANPGDAEIRGKVCMSERRCLEAMWTHDAVDRYMACRSSAPCGTDCQREITKKTPPGEALGAAMGRCQKLCAGGGSDGAALCGAVLEKFTPWPATSQAGAVQCFASTSDCFDALECARAATTTPAGELNACLGDAVGRACLDSGDAPMCREMRALLRPKSP